MPPQLRRIVTGHDADGKSIVAIDGPATQFGAYWQTEGAPADNRTTGDAAQAVRSLEPATGGSIFRYAVIPPEDPSIPREKRDPGMHKTRTIDYVILLSGEVTLLLDRGEVNLKPFDVVVQRGTNHAWINKGREPAIIAAVLVDAQKL